MYGKALSYVSKFIFGENVLLLTVPGQAHRVVKITLFFLYETMILIQQQCIRNRIPSMEDNNIFRNWIK